MGGKLLVVVSRQEGQGGCQLQQGGGGKNKLPFSSRGSENNTTTDNTEHRPVSMSVSVHGDMTKNYTEPHPEFPGHAQRVAGPGRHHAALESQSLSPPRPSQAQTVPRIARPLSARFLLLRHRPPISIPHAPIPPSSRALPQQGGLQLASTCSCVGWGAATCSLLDRYVSREESCSYAPLLPSATRSKDPRHKAGKTRRHWLGF